MEMTDEDRQTLSRLMIEGYAVILSQYKGSWDVAMFQNETHASKYGPTDGYHCKQCGFSGSLHSILISFEEGFKARGIQPGYPSGGQANA
jgi:hypothetical protein